MITTEDIDILYSIVARSDLPLETAAIAVRDSFNSSVKRFDFACAVSVLLGERLLLPSPHLRLSALYILHDLYAAAPAASHPFLSTFLDFVEFKGKDRGDGKSGLTITSCERYLVLRLLVDPDGAREEFSQRTTKLLLAQVDPSQVARALNTPQVRSQLSRLRESSDRFYGTASSVTGIFSTPTTTNPRDPTLQEALSAAKQLFEGARDDGEQMDLLGFDPPLFIPPPGILAPGLDELSYLTPPDVLHRIEWDYGISDSHQSTKTDETRRLMILAITEHITLTQQDTLCDLLSTSPKAILNSGLTPESLGGLVENNPEIAVQALQKLITIGKHKEYLNVLTTMKMSLNSLEVVNRLAGMARLPDEFMHGFLAHCVETCEQTKDKYMQNRQVRLLCVFLTSLIRNERISIPDFFVELQAFCIQFSRVREAVALFRLLKRETGQGNLGAS